MSFSKSTPSFQAALSAIPSSQTTAVPSFHTFSSSSTVPTQRTSISYSETQRSKLEEFFHQTQFQEHKPGQIVRLSYEIGLTKEQIRGWLRNRRRRGSYKGKTYHPVEHVLVLEWVFTNYTTYPCKKLKNLLSNELKMTYAQIKVWFQSRRQRGKPMILTREYVKDPFNDSQWRAIKARIQKAIKKELSEDNEMGAMETNPRFLLPSSSPSSSSSSPHSPISLSPTPSPTSSPFTPQHLPPISVSNKPPSPSSPSFPSFPSSPSSPSSPCSPCSPTPQQLPAIKKDSHESIPSISNPLLQTLPPLPKSSKIVLPFGSLSPIQHSPSSSLNITPPPPSLRFPLKFPPPFQPHTSPPSPPVHNHLHFSSYPPRQSTSLPPIHSLSILPPLQEPPSSSFSLRPSTSLPLLPPSMTLYDQINPIQLPSLSSLSSLPQNTLNSTLYVPNSFKP